jgi:ATP-binding protein involved in chromosome partitioning
MLNKKQIIMSELSATVKHVILIASGKGGVGKSTVASNLAVTLSRDGFSVGLLDADLYGPSIPLALGLENQHPVITKTGDKTHMEPLVNYGVKVMSLGFLMNKEDAIIWRGPMASNALIQLINDTHWGELDFLIIDMPPGTGDISITLAQKLPESKAIIVVTPQQMAISDGRKAAHMFKANGIDIGLIGIVENMSWFTPKNHPDEKYLLFGSGGGSQLSQELGVPMLAQIPIVADVCELGDSGKTIFASSNPVIVEAFESLANKVRQMNTVTI